VFRISDLENPRESSFILLPCAWKNSPLPPHPTYHPTTKEIGVEIFEMYNRIYNQQSQTNLREKFYPYHHLIKCPLSLPRPYPPSRGLGEFDKMMVRKNFVIHMFLGLLIINPFIPFGNFHSHLLSGTLQFHPDALWSY